MAPGFGEDDHRGDPALAAGLAQLMIKAALPMSATTAYFAKDADKAIMKDGGFTLRSSHLGA